MDGRGARVLTGAASPLLFCLETNNGWLYRVRQIWLARKGADEMPEDYVFGGKEAKEIVQDVSFAGEEIEEIQSDEAKPWFDWLRWIALPFAAFIGSALGSLAFVFLYWVGMKIHGGFSEDGWFYRFILPLLGAGMSGYLVPIISYKVAPKAKFISAVVMVSIMGAFIFISIIALFSFEYATEYRIVGVLRCIVTMVAAIMTFKDLRH